MTDPNNGAPAPQYPASNGTPDANNPAEPNTAAPQYGAPAPAYGQLSGNPYGQPAYGQEQPTQPNPAYSQPYGQPAGAQSAPAYGQPAYGQPNGNPYGQPDGAYGQVPPTYNAYPAPAAATDTNAVPLNKPYYGCSFQEAFLRFWKKYVVFKGRASRSEFWWWMLASFAIQVVLSTLVDVSNDHLSFLSSLWSLAILVPSIALSVRRLHDINKPGWWLAIFYGAVFAGAILMIVGGGAALFGVLRVWGSPSDSGYYATAAAGSLGILFIGAIIAAAAGIVYIVFMTLPSKPEGARFDDDFVAAVPYGAPVPPAGAPNGYAQAAPGYGDPNAAPYGQAAPTAPAYNPYAQQTARPVPGHDPYAQSTAPAAPTAYGQPAPTAPDYSQPATPATYTQPTAAQTPDYGQPAAPASNYGQPATPAPTAEPAVAPDDSTIPASDNEDDGQKPWQGQ